MKVGVRNECITQQHTIDESNPKITKKATCNETGTKTISCPCGLQSRTEDIPTTEDHQYGAWSETKASTCTENGQESRTCSVCEKQEVRELSAKDHQYGSWSVVKQPSSTEEGLKRKTCQICSNNEDEVIPKLNESNSNTSNSTSLITASILSALLSSGITSAVFLVIMKKKK